MDFYAVYGVKRPNHSLAHAVRKAVMLEHVVGAICLDKSTLPSNETMQAALVFEQAGRESEIRFFDEPEIYSGYKKASCTAFKAWADETNLPAADVHLCLKALAHMYTATTADAEGLTRIFEFVHELDLLRCFNVEQMKPKVDRLMQFFGEAEANRLLVLSEIAIRATGDRLMGQSQDYDAVLFERCSKNPALCIEAVTAVLSLCSFAA